MGRLTECDSQGNWCVKGLPWKDTYVGQTITDNTSEKTYSALCKLKDYEDTGLEPEEILTGVQLAEIACLQIRYKKRQELLERAAECIENCYGQETELSEAIRKEIN